MGRADDSPGVAVVIRREGLSVVIVLREGERDQLKMASLKTSVVNFSRNINSENGKMEMNWS